MKRGEITVFFSLMFLLIAAVIGAVIETARLGLCENDAFAATKTGVYSVAAEYHKELLEKYDLLFLDGSYKTSNFSKEKVEQHLRKFLEYPNSSLDFLKYELMGTSLSGYCLATDEKGELLRQQMEEYVINQNIAADIIEGTDLETWTKEQKNQEEEMKKQTVQNESEIKEGQNTEGQESQEAENINSPISQMEQLKASGILNLVLKDPESISKKQLPKQQKEYRQGNLKPSRKQRKLPTKLYTTEYFLQKFPNFCTTEKTNVLDYEAEYLLIGKSSDAQNLKGVSDRLILMRQPANFLHLMQSPEKQAEAEALAGVTAALAGLPALTPVFQKGILLAWAYGESVLDVRTLFAGGRVPLVKTAESWKLKLENIGTLTEDKEQEKSKEGLSYDEYLRLLFYLGKEEELCSRACTMIEGYMQKCAGHTGFSMDSCIGIIEMKTLWETDGVFTLFPMLKAFEKRKEFTCTGSQSYDI